MTRREADSAGFLFADLSIDPPLEEFRRVFEKRMRSFEADGADDQTSSYLRAYEIGRAKIERLLEGDDK